MHYVINCFFPKSGTHFPLWYLLPYLTPANTSLVLHLQDPNKYLNKILISSERKLSHKWCSLSLLCLFHGLTDATTLTSPKSLGGPKLQYHWPFHCCQVTFRPSQFSDVIPYNYYSQHITEERIHGHGNKWWKSS